MTGTGLSTDGQWLVAGLSMFIQHSPHNPEQNLHRHTESSIKCREPSIVKLATSYNQLCNQLMALIDKGEAPIAAVLPQPIQCDGLFKLDVDDNIWQDVSLDDDQDIVVLR